MSEPTKEELAKALALRLRGVDDPCLTCHGWGVQWWPSTATWRGGMGGARPTKDVCGTCWGTGDRYRTGVDLRRLRDEEERRVAEAAVVLLARSVGANLSGMAAVVEAVAAELDLLADGPRKRGAPDRPILFRNVCKSLARTLREGRNAKEGAGDG